VGRAGTRGRKRCGYDETIGVGRSKEKNTILKTPLRALLRQQANKKKKSSPETTPHERGGGGKREERIREIRRHALEFSILVQKGVNPSAQANSLKRKPERGAIAKGDK